MNVLLLVNLLDYRSLVLITCRISRSPATLVLCMFCEAFVGLFANFICCNYCFYHASIIYGPVDP